MTNITYNTEQMKSDLLAILNEKNEVTNTSCIRKEVKNKASISPNDRKGSAILDKIFRDLEEEHFIRKEGNRTDLTSKGEEAANHPNGYIGYQKEKREEEKKNKQNKKRKDVFEYIKDIITILLAIISFITANDNGLQLPKKQFWIGIIIGMSIIIILKYLKKTTIIFKFLRRRV